MRIRTLFYCIRQGIRGVWRNRMMSMASVFSITSVLIILGVVFTIVLNINSFTQITKDEFDSIMVDVSESASAYEMESLGKKIKNMEGVSSVSFISKNQALKNMKKKWGENGYLLEGLSENPLPNSYVIEVSNIERADEIVSKVKGLQGIEEVRYYKDMVDKILSVTNFVKLAGLGVIIVLVIISMFVVANTIKLTVIARKKEIAIMKYVGATNWFIRFPFVIEGIVLGTFAMGISVIVVGSGYKYLYHMITSGSYIMISAYMIPYEILVKSIVVIFAALGIGIGSLGSIVSMRKFLKV
ncbi:MAG: permease-like cell division protein FtsX [Anaeromicrobium sp.]|uniref:permease-like cell division protein FtsX n=1 Tax=Anaeromicrobium sp. TaxID=1929132 RepID=UPI0025FDF915|nr:permease-like cell division protein FtsX [Anaeromicrobium sp.]MCT4594554.1 permease-like cell division protein FtsX [Anaeromicrobium sp.]